MHLLTYYTQLALIVILHRVDVDGVQYLVDFALNIMYM